METLAFCLSQSLIRLFAVFGVVRVVRKCGYIDDAPSNSTCRRVTTVGEVYVTYCACKSDLCNASVSHHSGQMALLSIILFVCLSIYGKEKV